MPKRCSDVLSVRHSEESEVNAFLSGDGETDPCHLGRDQCAEDFQISPVLQEDAL